MPLMPTKAIIFMLSKRRGWRDICGKEFSARARTLPILNMKVCCGKSHSTVVSYRVIVPWFITNEILFRATIVS